MNLHVTRALMPLRSIKEHRSLIYSLIKRDVLGRYKGSSIGLLWSFFNPVLMMVIYTFVFSVVFRARWSGGSESKTEFAIVLFAGLLVFNLFSECISRAPSLIVGNVNYVKKVIFPLEILPLVTFGSAAFHFIISLLVWLFFYLIFFGFPPYTMFLLPFIIFPLAFMILGFSWLLASLGVYLRDVSQVTALILNILMFLSPIFYPISALPEKYRYFMNLNPITPVVEQMRDIMIWGKGLDWSIWFLQVIFSVIIAWVGFVWFQKTRKGFADVL